MMDGSSTAINERNCKKGPVAGNLTTSDNQSIVAVQSNTGTIEGNATSTLESEVIFAMSKIPKKKSNISNAKETNK